MKTSNNVQKTVSRLAAVIVMVLLTATVHDAAATSGKSHLASKSKKMVHYTFLQEATDAALHLEPWMVNIANFSTSPAERAELLSAESLPLKTECERPSILEPWMTSDNLWTIRGNK